jgi:predicted  nucleic acid-binding Zn-ribbon protein
VTVRAAPAEQVKLLDLQKMDNRTQQIQHARRNLPQLAELATITSTADALRRRMAVEQGIIEDLGTELRRVESDVAVVESRVARDSGRLQSTASAKDAQGLEHELASLARRQSDLEDMQLSVMQKLEDQEKVIAELEGERDALAERRDALEAERDAALAALDAEAVEVTAARETLAAGIPPDLLALYEKIRSRYGIGAALLRRGVSGGSNVALTGSDLAAVRAAPLDEVVLDPESGCILVRTEESGL